MNRQDIYNLIETIIPLYSVGQIKGPITKDCAILRRDMDLPSMGNAYGYWDQWTIDIYCVKGPLQVDKYVDVISSTLRNNDFEVQNMLSGDYYDEVMKAFSTSITFRQPKSIIN